MEQLKFYSPIDLESISLVDIIKRISNSPSKVIFDNMNKELDINSATMFMIEPEVLIGRLEGLNDELPKTIINTENLNLEVISPVYVEVI